MTAATVGSAAGLATSMLWTGTSLFFTAAGRRIGPTAVNAIRLSLAVVLLAITHRLRFGHWVPDAIGGQVAFLACSGVVGLSIGDQALFTAFVRIGPRLATLCMATAPVFATAFGWVVLHEALSLQSLLGVAMVVGGVAWVVLERSPTLPNSSRGDRVTGVLLAVVAAACQAGGLMLSKQGMGHGWLPPDQYLDPQAATLVRMVFACLGMAPIIALHEMRRRARKKRRAINGVTDASVDTAGPSRGEPSRIRAGLFFTLCGTICGPFLGVWMSLVATDRAPLGVAQALCSLVPVFILPFMIVIHKERVSPRAALGALTAVAGSAVLFFRGT